MTSRALSLLGLAVFVASCHAAPAPSLPPASATPESLLLGVAHGTRTLSSLVDPALGFVHVDFHTGAEDDSPREQTATQLCGDAMTPALRELAEHLRDALQFEEARLRCEGLVCVDPPRMEFDAERTYRFALVGGRVRLVSVTRIDPFSPEEMVRDHRERAAAAEQAVGTARCPGA